MTTEQLEHAIRQVLRENVDGITAESLHADRLRERLSAPSALRSWLPPMLAAAIVVLVAVAVGAAVLPQRSEHTSAAGIAAVSGSLDGSWHLVSGQAGGARVDVPERPPVTLSFREDGTVVIDDGVNVTVATVHREPHAFTARFRSTTYVLDDGSDAAARRALLRLLDSLAPSAAPRLPTHSTYRIDGSLLSIHTPAGELMLMRSAPAPSQSSRAAQTPSDAARGRSETAGSAP